MFLYVYQVAQFLRVNPETGLFFFDSSYRPVPLAQQYIGISEHNFLARMELLNEICYNKVFSFPWIVGAVNNYVIKNLWCMYFHQVVDSLRRGHQAMVFVHSRKDTGKTAEKLVTWIQDKVNNNALSLLSVILLCQLLFIFLWERVIIVVSFEYRCFSSTILVCKKEVLFSSEM